MAKRGRKKKVTAPESEKAESVATPAVEAGKAEPKHRGRKSQYSEEQKKAFVDAVKNGRKADASWAEILDAAKTQGFKGSLPYLKKMAATGGAIKSGGRRGRPKGSKNAVKRGRPAGSTVRVASNGANLSDIEAIVSRMVEERVAVAMKRAVTTLERATKELQNL
jgi:hypothetical protein